MFELKNRQEFEDLEPSTLDQVIRYKFEAKEKQANEVEEEI